MNERAAERLEYAEEDLNPADTAARYPDADEIDLDRPAETLAEVGEPLEWIRTRSNG